MGGVGGDDRSMRLGRELLVTARRVGSSPPLVPQEDRRTGEGVRSFYLGLDVRSQASTVDPRWGFKCHPTQCDCGER